MADREQMVLAADEAVAVTESAASAAAARAEAELDLQRAQAAVDLAEHNAVAAGRGVRHARAWLPPSLLCALPRRLIRFGACHSGGGHCHCPCRRGGRTRRSCECRKCRQSEISDARELVRSELEAAECAATAVSQAEAMAEVKTVEAARAACAAEAAHMQPRPSRGQVCYARHHHGQRCCAARHKRQLRIWWLQQKLQCKRSAAR